MSFSKNVAAAVIAAAGLLATVGAASAVDAYAKSNVNVRSGPGGGFSVVDQLYSGELVDVTECQGSWCYINHDGNDGWVAASYLANSSGGGSGSGSGSNPPVNFGITVGPGGPSFSLSVGNQPAPAPAPGPAPKVCFYANQNYGGASFCVNAGTNSAFVGAAWNDRISSIRVFGGAQVTVCKHNNYAGTCKTYANNRPTIGTMNNQISSYQTWY